MENQVCTLLCEIPGLYEKSMQELWYTTPSGTKLKLTDGRTCEILFPGIWNHGPGPDFSDATIRIAEKELKGDVELHCRTTDWIRHGHAQDPLYGHVILHVIDFDDTSVENTPLLPEVPRLCLPREWNSKSKRNPSQPVFCQSYFHDMSDEELHRFAESAGIDRMRRKADELLYRMIRDGVWRAFFCKFMDLSGVPSSREEFRKLAERVADYPDDVLQEHFSAILWGESGLLPDPAAVPLPGDALSLAHDLWEEWWKLRRDTAPALSAKVGARPLNSMERRLAAASLFTPRWLKRLTEKLPAILSGLQKPADLTKRLQPELCIHDPFWETHITFTSPALKRKSVLLGEAKCNLLMTDLLIPAFHAILRMNGKENLLPVLEQCYLCLPPNPSNRITRIMQEYCFPGREQAFRTAAAQQGLIHLHRSFCQPLSFQCHRCPFRNSVSLNRQ